MGIVRRQRVGFLRHLGRGLEGSLVYTRGLLFRHRAVASIFLADGVVLHEGRGLRPDGEEQDAQDGHSHEPPPAVPRTPATVAFRPRWFLLDVQGPLLFPRVASATDLRSTIVNRL